MKRKTYSGGNNLYRFAALLAGLFMLFILAGCAGGNYGTLHRDRDLDNMFLSYQVLPDHRYYITGGYAAPTAILAIHRDYELVNTSDLWVGVPNVDSGQVRRWIDAISPEMYRGPRMYSAAYILDTAGKKVGAWYSIESSTTVKFLEGNKLQVYTPSGNSGINDFSRGIMLRGRY